MHLLLNRAIETGSDVIIEAAGRVQKLSILSLFHTAYL